MSYWAQEGALHHITPPGDRWPEGGDFPAWCGANLRGRVLEFGCGDGRLASGFGPERYIGVDISSHAVARARLHNPDHTFFQVPEDHPLPYADLVLAHTVLLHVPDEDLPGVAATLTAAAPTVLVSEIMGHQWRRGGDPPVYNRAPEDYEHVFGLFGMKLTQRWEHPYNRYGGVSLTMLQFRRGVL